MTRSKLSALLIVNLFFAAHCFAENEFSFRIAPGVEIPLGLPQFGPGIGALASFDWAFGKFAQKFNAGIGVEGAFASIPVQTGPDANGNPLTLLGGRIGPFIRWRPHDRWAVRAAAGGGVYQYVRGDDSKANLLAGFTAGAEFLLSPYFSLFADSAFTYRVFSSDPLNSIGLSLGLRLNLSEIMGGRARVKIEKTAQYNVFPVSWAWYEQNPVATIKVTNEEPNTITGVNLLFFTDSYMSQPWTFASIDYLAPGESAEVPVTALFNEAMLSLTENVNAHSVLQMQYQSLGARKETSSSMQMPIFRRNTLSWDDDRRAAAFVSQRDSAAHLFARYTAGAVEAAEGRQGRNMPPNVVYAAALFEALRLYGISYIIDPASSYIALSEDEAALDNLNYPYETLKYRGGDCDDLSILFCTVLEALSIESAFITIPGHIYTAFAIGDNNWLAGSSDIIVIDGKRWMPVEITVPGEGFTRAWRIGAQQWKKAGNNAALYPIRGCWTVYPPVTVPESGDSLPEMPEWNDIVKAMESQLQLVR